MTLCLISCNSSQPFHWLSYLIPETALKRLTRSRTVQPGPSNNLQVVVLITASLNHLLAFCPSPSDIYGQKNCRAPLPPDVHRRVQCGRLGEIWKAIRAIRMEGQEDEMERCIECHLFAVSPYWQHLQLESNHEVCWSAEAVTNLS